MSQLQSAHIICFGGTCLHSTLEEVIEASQTVSMLLTGEAIDQLQVRYEKLVYSWKLPSFLCLLPVSLPPPVSPTPSLPMSFMSVVSDQ